MNSLIVLLIALVVAALGYLVYGRYIDRNIVKADAKKPTPAKMYMDGVDFTPTSRNILFGFQFKSIAATGPVVGAITAIQWGWVPAFLWLIFGVFFIGWVQDYMSAMMSMRNEGQTFGGLSYRFISPRARVILLSFIYFYLILIAAAFMNLIASQLADPKVPLGVIAVLLMGALAGYLIYTRRMDILATIVVTVGIAVIAIWAGSLDAISAWFSGLPKEPVVGAFPMNKFIWALLALIPCYFGSVLPIWRFTQPTIFVAFWIVAILMLGGVVGVLVLHPTFNVPAYATWNIAPAAGPAAGTVMTLWPMLFVTIACGAISGWHSLVSSSGTARQLESEADALPVTGGSMLAEMILAVIALIAGGAAVANFDAFKETFGKLGPGGVFSQGMGTLMGSFGIPPNIGQTYAGAVFVMLALTILLLVFRFVRVATAELVGDAVPVLKNMHVATIVGLLITLFLVSTGTFNLLWQLFGGSNQLLAALALMMVSLWLVSEGKRAAFAALPMAFMFITTIGALLLTAWNLYVVASKASDAGVAAGNYLMSILSLFLVVAALVLAWDGWTAFRRYRTAPKVGPTADQKVTA
ncbi:MAG: carbon starvation protein A [Bacteroidetes bacterium]|nr:carbon starvation protein A [Bacteroidota bacterium]MCL5026700.1 carbon starvation protein A [Chloroflexota bacterium]